MRPNRLHAIRLLLADTRERWFFFPLDWDRRRQQPWIKRSRFWHRAAARRVARRLMWRHGDALLHTPEGQIVSITPEELSAHVLRKVGGYDVRARDVLAASRIPGLIERVRNRLAERLGF